MAVTLTTTSDTPEQVAEALKSVNRKATVAVPEAPLEGAVVETEDETKPASVEGDEGETEVAGAAAKPAEGEKPAETEEDERVGRLTWERYQLMSQVERLQAQLAEKKAADDRAAAEVANRKPTFADPKPKIDSFQTVEAWTEALAEWTEKKLKFEFKAESDAANANTEAGRAAAANEVIFSAHRARIDKFRETHPDFDTVAQTAIEQRLPVTPMMEAHFVHSDMGPELMYYLGTHPDECKKIAAMNMGPALVALGEIQADLRKGKVRQAGTDTSATATAAVTRPPVKPTVVPRPVKPSGAGATTTSKDPSQMTYAEFKRWRALGGGRR